MDTSAGESLHKVLRNYFQGSNKRPQDWPEFICNAIQKEEYLATIPEDTPRAVNFKLNGNRTTMTLLEFDQLWEDANVKANVRINFRFFTLILLPDKFY